MLFHCFYIVVVVGLAIYAKNRTASRAKNKKPQLASPSNSLIDKMIPRASIDDCFIR